MYRITKELGSSRWQVWADTYMICICDSENMAKHIAAALHLAMTISIPAKEFLATIGE